MHTQAGRLATILDNHAVKFLRYCGVSVFNVGFAQVALIVFHSGLGFAGWLANVAAVCVGSIPAFLLNQKFVWRQTGPTSLRKHVLPFLGLNVLGLLLSTGAVKIADSIWGTQLAVNAASLSAWAGLWLGKYLCFDRLLFRQHPVATETAPAGSLL